MYLNIIRSPLTALLVFFVLAFCILVVLPATTHAFFQDEPVELNGYAWSSTIGWISLGNNGNEQVTINTDGTVTGYAWSPNVGWIHFGGAANQNFPTGGGTEATTPRLVENPVGSGTYELRGWARACGDIMSGICEDRTSSGGVTLALDVLRLATGLEPSYIDTTSDTSVYDVDGDGSVDVSDALDILRVAVRLQTSDPNNTGTTQSLINDFSTSNNFSTSDIDSWDGWIALSGASHAVQFIESGPVDGSYAWGDDVVGWIDMFSAVTYEVNASADLTVVGCEVAAGASSCNGSVSWQFIDATNPIIERTVPSQDTIFPTAVTARGFSAQSASVLLSQASVGVTETGSRDPYPMIFGTNTFVARDDSGILNTVTLSIGCAAGAVSNGSGGCMADPALIAPSTTPPTGPTAPPTAPTVNTFDISPPIVRKGQDITVTWDAAPALCTVTTTQGDTIPPASSGNEDITITANNQVVVTLTCDGIVVGQETVRVLPNIFES